MQTVQAKAQEQMHQSNLEVREEARLAMERQKEGFRQVAHQYELEARDMCGAEVAEAKSRTSAVYQSALNQASDDLNRHQHYVQNLSKDLVVAQSMASVEAANAKAMTQNVESEVQIQREEVLLQAQQLVEIERSKHNQMQAEYASQASELRHNLLRRDSVVQDLTVKFDEAQHDLF